MEKSIKLLRIEVSYWVEKLENYKKINISMKKFLKNFSLLIDLQRALTIYSSTEIYSHHKRLWFYDKVKVKLEGEDEHIT